ncbi:hippurate hydrolase [Nocardiopsis mwathae]|uniref:Hippurate hydrolase n=2 Tax=Nocardiopsis mwathae TaxID=1472723 RepID=A0A7W9YE06_9ACTN|nr:amidohydrolase [Nocardiopsis mwathae]MBB6170250.1 hippurate hydrolase [Nocardiopsis mwathae]
MRLVDEIFPLVEGFYVDLHKNPELSHAEYRTANSVAEWLTRSGFEVTTGVGGTGVVGLLRNGDGPTVMLRADMDALPMEEKTGLPYASTAHGTDADGNEVPIMHACGHDAHTACLVGTADLLAEARDRWRGTLMVVAQPAEETIEGADAMVADGLYERFGRPDVILGQHVGPQPAGMVSHRAGVLLAASEAMSVRVFGSGGHASRPDATVDPVVIAANIITRLQTVVSREISPSEMAVVTVGMVRAGTKANIIPDEAYLEINTRALNELVAGRLRSAIDRIVRAEAAASGAPRDPEITVLQQAGVTANDPDHTRDVSAAHRAYFGEGYVIDLPEPVTGSEDFGAFGLPGHPEPIPYVYWFIGGTPHDVWQAAPGDTPYEKLASVPSNHSPFFAPDREPTLRAGLAALTIGALTYLGRERDAAPTGEQQAFPAEAPPESAVADAAPFAEPAAPTVAEPAPMATAAPVPAPEPEPEPGEAAAPEEPGAEGADEPAAGGEESDDESTHQADMAALLEETGGTRSSGDDVEESTQNADMAALLAEEDAVLAPTPPQGTPVAAPPPQGAPIAAPPPPQGSTPYPGSAAHTPDQDPPQEEPPYRL